MITLTQQEVRLHELAEPIAQDLGVTIVRLRVEGGRRPRVQIMIERIGGADSTIKDCENLSRELGPTFDVHDPVTEAYILEVSTPGIDRPLTRPGDFRRWIGQAVRVELKIPLEGRRKFTGVITAEDEDGTLRIDVEQGVELACELDDMTKAQLVLTDKLIDATAKAGNLPPQPGAEDFTPFEIDDSDESLETTENTGDPA